MDPGSPDPQGREGRGKRGIHLGVHLQGLQQVELWILTAYVQPPTGSTHHPSVDLDVGTATAARGAFK